jgi:hypothetical protein
MKQILIIFIVLIGAAACQKELDISEFKVKPYFDAHNSQGQWTENRIFDSLVGVWQWQYMKCDESGFSSFDKNASLTIQFAKDSILIATQNGKSTKTRFSIAVEDRVSFSVVQDSLIASLDGRIYFYDNKVVFNDSYIDGCDNYFIRLK